MIDPSAIPLSELREKLRLAEEAEQLASFDDNHESYTRRVASAKAEQAWLRKEIMRRVELHEANHGR